MITIIHHSADYDGKFCREIASHFLRAQGEVIVEYIGWDFSDPPIPFKELEGKDVIVMDLPCDAIVGAQFPPDELKTLDMHGQYYGCESLVWIDHHKTAIASHPKHIPGYRVDGVAACRLAWQWFDLPRIGGHVSALVKEDFIKRKVTEPLAVRLAGEYDIWDKRDPRAETFQYALRASNQFDESLDSLLQPNAEPLIEEMLKLGAAAQHYAQRENASLVKYRSFEMDWQGLRFLCLNTARCNSLTFAAGVKPEHDGLLGYYWNGRNWVVSLYGVEHKPDVDLSAIAKAYGGGGHKQACGFSCSTLPFHSS